MRSEAVEVQYSKLPTSIVDSLQTTEAADQNDCRANSYIVHNRKLRDGSGCGMSTFRVAALITPPRRSVMQIPPEGQHKLLVRTTTHRCGQQRLFSPDSIDLQKGLKMDLQLCPQAKHWRAIVAGADAFLGLVCTRARASLSLASAKAE